MTSRKTSSAHLWFLVFITQLMTAQLVISMQYATTFKLGDETLKGHFVGNVPQSIPNFPPGPFRVLIGESIFSKLTKFFHISDSGNITTNANLDRDNRNDVCGPLNCCDSLVCNISFLAVFEKGNNRYDVRVLVQLRDENDNSPQFALSTRTITLSEGPSGRTINDLGQATDLDSVQNQVKRYEIVDATQTFSLIDNTRSSLQIKLPLDYEQKGPQSFHITIQAIDGGEPAKTGELALTIRVTDVNDNSPEFNKRNSKVSIPENTRMNTLLPSVPKASDLDSGENGLITYTLGGPSMSQLANTKFAINSTTGQIRVIGTLDYEKYSEQQFELPIIATDNGIPSLTATATLTVSVEDVNDNYPQIEIQKNVSVPENSPPNLQVLNLYIRDEDKVSHGKFRCLYVSSKGLELNKPSEISFFVLTSDSFDYEKTQQLWIEIECIDNAEPPLRKKHNLTVAIIDLNDNAPVFEQSFYTKSISEDTAEKQPVLTVKATDSDSGKFGEITYRLDSNGERYFSLNPTTGLMILKRSLDREVRSNIRCRINAFDGGGLNTSIDVSIMITDVNDNHPELLGEPMLAVVENSPKGTLVGKLQFQDLDAGGNGTISMSTLKHRNATVTNFLELKPDGRIVTRNEVDRETYANLFLEVVAWDNGSPRLSTTVTLSIRVLDVNDHAPQLGYPPSETTVGYSPAIYTNTPWHFHVVTLSGSDSDQLENGSITYRMHTSNATGYFDLNTTSGRLYTAWTELDPPKEGLYLVDVELSDRGTPSLSSRSRFYVNVGSANENTGPEPTVANRGTLTNVVILILIIVFAVALGSALIAAIVWARSRTARMPQGPYPDYAIHVKVPDETDHIFHPDGLPPPSHGKLIGTLKSMGPPEGGHVDNMYTMSLSRHDPHHFQTFYTSDDPIPPQDRTYLSMAPPPPPPPHKSPRVSQHSSPATHQPPLGQHQNNHRLPATSYEPLTFPRGGVTGLATTGRNGYSPGMGGGSGGVGGHGPLSQRYSDHSYADSGRGGSIEDMTKYQLTGTSSFTGGTGGGYLPKHTATLKRTPEEGTIC